MSHARLVNRPLFPWNVVLRLPNGRTRKVGASSHATRDQAIEAAIRHVWNPKKTRKSLGQFTIETNVIECERREDKKWAT